MFQRAKCSEQILVDEQITSKQLVSAWNVAWEHQA